MNKLIWLIPAIYIVITFIAMPIAAGKSVPKNATEDDDEDFMNPYLLTGKELERAVDASKRGARF